MFIWWGNKYIFEPANSLNPNTELFKGQLNLDENNYIIADETTKTNIEGVFAVGDVRRKALRQIVTATSDGANCSKSIEEYLMFN